MNRIVAAGPRDAATSPRILGRRRAIPELRSPERQCAQAAERVATNTPIQGSAADLIKLAMVRDRAPSRAAAAGARRWSSRSTTSCCWKSRRTTARRRQAVVREEMEGSCSLAVPLRVDLGVGRTWAEAH